MKSLFHKRVGCSYKAEEESSEVERALVTRETRPEAAAHRPCRARRRELGGGLWRCLACAMF